MAFFSDHVSVTQSADNISHRRGESWDDLSSSQYCRYKLRPLPTNIPGNAVSVACFELFTRATRVRPPSGQWTQGRALTPPPPPDNQNGIYVFLEWFSVSAPYEIYAIRPAVIRRPSTVPQWIIWKTGGGFFRAPRRARSEAAGGEHILHNIRTCPDLALTLHDPHTRITVITYLYTRLYPAIRV